MSATIARLLDLGRQRTPETVVEKSMENGQVPYPEAVAADWADFLHELEGLGGVYQDPAEGEGHRFQGQAETLQRLISIYVGDGLSMVWVQWRGARIAARRRADHQRMLDSTAGVRPWRGDEFGREKRVPLTDLGAWVRPGHLLLERDADVRAPSDQGSDAMSTGPYRLLTMPIGRELPEGTVKAKRMVDGRVQYLVRPRSKAAERRYQLRLELEQLQADRQVNFDWDSEEQRATRDERIRTIKSQLGEGVR